VPYTQTSICDRTGPQQELALTTSEKGDGIFPVVNLKVNGVECCVLINTGAGSSYILVNLIGLLKIKPVNVEVKQVDIWERQWHALKHMKPLLHQFVGISK